MPRNIRTMEERFWSNVSKDGPVPTGHPEYADLGACWLYSGPSINMPRAHLAGPGEPRCISVSRYSWQIHNLEDSIPKGMVIRHKCDNGHMYCVNPAHLELGTQKQNSEDRWRRRIVPMRDMITSEQADAMIDAYNMGVPIKTLAAIARVIPEAATEAIYGGRSGVVPAQANRRKPPITDEQVAQATALLIAGRSMSYAAVEVGTNWTTLRAAFKSRGVEIPATESEPAKPIPVTQRRPITDADVAHVVEAMSGGATLRAASLAIGRDSTPMRRAMEARGLTVTAQPYRRKPAA